MANTMSISDLRPIMTGQVKDKWRFIKNFYQRDWIFSTILEKGIFLFLFFYFVISMIFWIFF